jgi:hypothetical protein
MYENLLVVDPRELPEIRQKIEKDARKLYHSLDQAKDFRKCEEPDLRLKDQRLSRYELNFSSEK